MPKVLKSYGTAGEVLTNLAADGDINLKEPVFIVFDELPVPFFFESVKPHGSRTVVKFEDVDSFDDAEELVGRELLLSIEEDDSGDDGGIVGRLICDACGKRIGRVTEFLDYGGNTCISVDCNGREVILPIHEDLIVKVTKKAVWLTIPEGLL